MKSVGWLPLFCMLIPLSASAAVTENWDDGNGFSGWDFEHRCEPYNFNLVPAPAGLGNTALRVENRLSRCGDRARTEIHVANYAEPKAHYGKDFWWRFRVYIPPDWPTAPMPVGWLTIAQIIPGSHATGWDPDFKLTITKDHRWGFDGPGGGNYGRVSRGAWVEWLIQHRRATGTGGVTNVWMNGNQVVSYQGGNTFESLPKAVAKFGIYAGARQAHDTYVLYFDDIVMSHEPLAPGGPLGPQPPPTPPTPLPPPTNLRLIGGK